MRHYGMTVGPIRYTAKALIGENLLKRPEPGFCNRSYRLQTP